MSSINQSNGKKSGGSGGSSTVNTPASTPVTSVASISNGQTATQTSPPPNNNAPKYGTLVPNRIFVGGISANTTEGELLQLFSNYGTVKAAKIIQDRAGVSKGYGFITFESEDDAKRLQREADNIVLRERKLNIAPAIKKQPFSRAFDASSPPAVAAGNAAQYYFQPGTIPYFQSSMAYYPPPAGTAGDPNTQQPPMYQPPSVYPAQSGPPQTATYPPVMFPAQPIYMPQQYPVPMPYDYNYYTNGGPQYMVGGQGGPQSQVPPMQRPGSPPRPPCYGQQLPYNPEAAMYYNVPMYNTIEGPTLYQDSLDMANGAITEDNYPMDDNIVRQVIEIQHSLQYNTERPPEPHEAPTNIPDTTRHSITPVVSLLSIEQQQEKDFTSMQSGRRRKSISTSPPNVNNNTPHSFNGYTNSYPGYFNNMNLGSAPNSYNYPPNNFTQPPYSSFNRSYGNEFNYSKYTTPCKTSQILNGQDKSWTRRRRNANERYSCETSSLSSIRTDSNSSASVVDENRNESKPQNSPPPPPYSPFNSQHHGHTGNKYYSSRLYHNKGPARGGYGRLRGFGYYTNVHAGSQHFIPPARRNRRSVRRNNAPISEIGAGDAPLPNADVSDTCKKLDSLKL